jgi:hypothetical protein
MKYLLQVRFHGAEASMRSLAADEQAKLTAEFEAIRETPGVLDASQLQAPDTAATVRVDGGRTVTSPGPAVEAGGQVDGYYIYDAPDLDTAIVFAARIPVARMGGSVEVRALMER